MTNGLTSPTSWPTNLWRYMKGRTEKSAHLAGVEEPRGKEQTRLSAPSTSPPLVNIIIDQCPTMPIPSTTNKCSLKSITPPPRYQAPKRHFLPASPMRPPTQSLTLPSSQARPTQPPSRLETEPLISLLFQSEGHSPGTQPPLRPNRLVHPSLTRTERIMLR